MNSHADFFGGGGPRGDSWRGIHKKYQIPSMASLRSGVNTVKAVKFSLWINFCALFKLVCLEKWVRHALVCGMCIFEVLISF